MAKPTHSQYSAVILLGDGRQLRVSYTFAGDALEGIVLGALTGSDGEMVTARLMGALVHAIVLASLRGRATLAADANFCRLTVRDIYRRLTFLPLAIRVSGFQREVFRYLLNIPAGSTVSYGELAQALQSSAQAVGQALAANPLPLLIPCHRVVRADGGLGGFSAAGGAEVKEALLRFERLSVQEKHSRFTKAKRIG